MSARIEAYAPSHLPALADLWVSAWQAAYPAIDFAARRGWFVERMTAMAAEGVTIHVAVIDGQPVGFVTVNRADGWIDQLMVGIAHQGQGIASLLMAAAKKTAPKGLDLDVNADNAGAIAFYRQQGFVTTGSRVNDQGRAIDLMAWRPEPPRLGLRPS